MQKEVLVLWIGLIVSGNDEVFDFMTEHEVAEILATEELLEVDMDTFNEDEILPEEVATDSDYE
jgi:hypothetical protein